MDTLFAVKSLSLLGIKPRRPEQITRFFLRQIQEGSLGGIAGLFCAAEVLNELHRMTDEFRSYAKQRITPLQNKAGGFGAFKNVYIEVPSELEETYRAVNVLKTIGAGLNKEKIARFVSRFLNPDGGYGSKGHSTLASTFYAIGIHGLLGTGSGSFSITRDYLVKMEREWQVQFIENLYWLVSSLVALGERPRYPDRAARFVNECQRTNGGFARATIMGIPTLEYTYYALTILRETGLLQVWSSSARE